MPSFNGLSAPCKCRISSAETLCSMAIYLRKNYFLHVVLVISYDDLGILVGLLFLFKRL